MTRGRILAAPAWQAPDLEAWARDILATYGAARFYAVAAYAWQGTAPGTRCDAPRYASEPAPVLADVSA